jgi:hypothetical protein
MPDVHLYSLHERAIESDKMTVYHSVKSGTRRTLLVWFGGGGFVSCDRKSSYGFLNELFNLSENDLSQPPIDIVTFDYPSRLERKLNDIIKTIDSLLTPFAADVLYDRYVAIGMSAGAFLLGSFMNKEDATMDDGQAKIGLKFNAVVFLNGVLMPDFDNTILNWIFKYYILRDVVTPRTYTCLGIGKFANVFVISARGDILHKNQSARYVAYEAGSKREFLADKSLPHNFALMMNYKISRRVCFLIYDFFRV